MRKLPAGAPRDIAAAVVAAHYSEQKYLERARDRVEEAIQQLPKGDDCWVALWWTNGAPLGSMRQLLTTIDFPPHILGIALLGAVVVFPDPEIHYYHFFIPRDLSEDERPKVVSLVDHFLAEKILEIVEESSGVRPTLIVHPEGHPSETTESPFSGWAAPPLSLQPGPGPRPPRYPRGGGVRR